MSVTSLMFVTLLMLLSALCFRITISNGDFFAHTFVLLKTVRSGGVINRPRELPALSFSFIFFLQTIQREEN
jgi:hypothetical protein